MPKMIRRGYMTHNTRPEGGNACHALNEAGDALCGTWMSFGLNEANPIPATTAKGKLFLYIDCRRCLKKLGVRDA